MSLRRLALLAAVLLAVGGFYYVYEVRGADERAEREAEAKELFHFEPDNAAVIELRRPDETIRLAKHEGEWRIVEPLDERADSAAVSSLLSSLESLTPTRALENIENFEQYGLAEPSFTIAVEDQAGQALAVLEAGDANPAYTSRFVRAKDAPEVGLIPTGTFDAVAKDLFDVRNKQWTTLAYSDVQRVRLERRDELDVRLTRTGDGWQVEGEPPRRADAFKVQSLINRLLNARIVDFVAEDDADAETYGLTTPAYSVTVQGEGAQAQLHFGDEVPDQSPARRYATVEGDARVVAFNGSVLDIYPLTPSDLRDPKILTLSSADVTKLKLTNAERVLTLSRDPAAADAWTLDGPEAPLADAAEVDNLLDNLVRLRAERFLSVGEEPVEPADFDAAPVLVEAWAAARPEPVRVRFAQGPASEQWYARTDGDPEVYPVADWAARVFQTTRQRLRDTHLLRFDADAVQRIELAVGGREMTYTRRGDERWRPGPNAPRLEDARMAQLLVDLAELQYREVLSADAVSTDAAPQFSATLFDAAGEPLGSLRAWGTVERDTAKLRVVEAEGLAAGVDERFFSEWTAELTETAD